MLSPISVTPFARASFSSAFMSAFPRPPFLKSWVNEHGEYFATDQTTGSHQFPILLDDKGCPGFAAICNFLFGMEILEELHRPRRVDCRVADPNGLAYQSHELAEVRLLKPANAYVVGVIHSPS